MDNSLTAEVATYKEQVELYERRTRFELTEREQNINEQLRIIITDRNIKEENLKKELHSVKLQLASTINHNKSMVEEVMSLKKDFKQKENKYIEEFLDMKALKEKVAICYKNPLCRTRAKQVQPALYKDHEIIKTNHVPVIVHNSEDTLDIAEITRKKMNEKMKNPECVQKKVKIKPPDYSKENYLATFTPQKQLTPEQIFWSQDLIKMKAEALKTQATALRPIKALMVYPPNTPATLVPRVLPTKKHFEGIQKALTKEIKEMKDIFEELEAEVDQNEVFYVATNSELNVSSFTEMHDAHTSLKARCLELEVELSNLRDKIQKDNHDELIKRFSNLEVNHLNLQLKYQNLKESFETNTSPPARDVPDFDSVFVIEKMKASIQRKDNAINKLRMQISQLKETRSEADRKYAIDVEPIPPRNRNNREVHLVYLKHLKESVETLREIVEEAKVERPLDSSLASACRYTKHSQELLEYVIGTCPKDLNTRDNKHASTPLPKKKQVTFEEQCAMSKSNTHKPVEQLNCQKTNVPVPPSIGVNSCTNARRSQPRINTKKNKILPAKSVNMKKVEEHPRTIKSSLKTMNRVDSSISFKHTVIQIVLWYLDSGYSKHMVGDRSWLRNFMKKFIGTFLRSKDEAPEVVIKFLKQIQVGLNKTIRNIHTDNGIEFVNKDLTDYYECVRIFYQKTVPRTLQHNGVVERQNHTLVEAARTMLIFSKALMFLWAEVVATACYTLN
ncbi:retrovirus-related pol polyprotein from transposon TNT 1-94 [Tanacetum coccineum]